MIHSTRPVAAAAAVCTQTRVSVYVFPPAMSTNSEPLSPRKLLADSLPARE